MLSEIRQAQKEKYHDSTSTGYLKHQTDRSRESHGGRQALGGGRKGEYLFNAYKVSVTQDEEISGVPHTMVAIVNNTLLHT